MTDSFGLPKKHLEEIQKILNSALTQKESFSVDVFGSRARGDFKKYSDIDLWIEANPDLTRDELSELKEMFEDSNLPIKVDIVTQSTVLAEYLPSIQKERTRWFRD